MLLIKSTNATSMPLIHSKQNVTHHPRRFWKTITILANELCISQPFSDYAAHYFNKPAYVIVFALVESERLLVQIPEQMKRLNVHIRPVDSALKQRPKVFQSVRVDASFHIALGMVDELVRVLVRQAHVGKML